jgi:O-antigen ligase
VTLDRVAFGSLVLLALCVGLGDIAQVTSFGMVLLDGVRGLLPLVIGLSLLATLMKGRRPAFPGRLAVPAAAWLLVLVVSAAVAPSNRLEALASLERPASGALLAWAVYELCRSRARWRLLAQAAALSGLAVALVGLAEASGIPTVRDWLAALHDGAVPIGDVPRVASTLSHPNEAAMLLELSLPLLVAWAWTAPRPWRALLALGALSDLVAMVLTFSRAGVVAGMAGLAIMAGLCVVRGERRPLLSLSAAALAVPAALLCAAMTDPGLDRRLTAELTDTPTPALSVGPRPSRMEFWIAALEMLHDRPWLGVGPDNFRWRFADYSGVPADNLGIHAHDQYLEALADTGVLGLLSLGWLLVRLVRIALDGVRRGTQSADWPWRAAMLASLSAWLLHALLDDFERFWPASVVFWLLAGLNLRVPGRPVTERRVSGSHARTLQQHKPSIGAALSAGALLFAAACGQGGSPANTYPTINGISCDTTEKVAFHIHAHLAIFADGQPLTVPYGIGIGKPWQVQQSSEGPFVVSGSCFYWLHTHTQDGVIHIESPVQRAFTLGDFFAIWGQPLSTSQVATAQGSVVAYVNGERSGGDPNEIPLQAHELIQLNVGQDVPLQPFTFTPGL